MEHQKPITKKLFIEELEKPAQASTVEVKEDCEIPEGKVTTLALGEECFKF